MLTYRAIVYLNGFFKFCFLVTGLICTFTLVACSITMLSMSVVSSYVFAVLAAMTFASVTLFFLEACLHSNK